MFDILLSILDTINIFIRFFISLITGLIFFISQIPRFISILASSIGLMPSVLVPFLTVTISVYVILFILGRNS